MKKEQAQQLEAALLHRFLELGKKAQLRHSTLAKIIGVSQARLYKLTNGGVRGCTLLMVYDAVNKLEAGLENGWLPCKSWSSKVQKELLQHFN